MTITFELWSALRGLFFIDFVLSVVALLFGDLPDHYGNPVANGLRWIAWPLFVILAVAFLLKGVLL